MITGGWFNDKFTEKVLLAGTIMYSIGLILSGFAVNTSMLLLTYGIIGGLGLGMAYGCTISTAVKYFPDKRGLIGELQRQYMDSVLSLYRRSLRSSLKNECDGCV